MNSGYDYEFSAIAMELREMLTGMRSIASLRESDRVMIDGDFWTVTCIGFDFVLLESMLDNTARVFTRTNLAELWLTSRALFECCRSVEALLDEAGSWAWRRLPCALRGKLSSDGRMLTFERALDRYEGSDHIVRNTSRLSDPVRWEISCKVTSCAYKSRATSQTGRLRSKIRHVLRLEDREAREFLQYREHLRTYGDRPFFADLLDSFAQGVAPFGLPLEDLSLHARKQLRLTAVCIHPATRRNLRRAPSSQSPRPAPIDRTEVGRTHRVHAFSYPTALNSLRSLNLTERDSLVVDGFSFIPIRTLRDGVEVRSEGCGLVRFLSWNALGSLCSEERLHVEHGRAGMASAVVELAEEGAGTSAPALLLGFGPPSDRSRCLN